MRCLHRTRPGSARRSRSTTSPPVTSTEESPMPKVSRQTASRIQDHGPIAEAREDLEGTAVQFLTTKQDLDATPLMKGLPDDRCSAPHWGYVFKGRLTFDCGDHEEVFEAGDAFYIGPGHIPTSSEPGTEYLQFSPAEELDVVSEVLTKNVQALQAQTS